MKRYFAFGVLLVLAALCSPGISLRADGFIVVDEAYWLPRPPHPGPPIWPPRPIPPPREYLFAPLEVTYHHVSVKIHGQIATTSVDQEFFNPNPSRLEGTYLFPIPKGAQIDKFTMDIGGKQVEAELLPAEKARRIYEDIVRKAKDPALLEYADRDVFKVRVFPIEPKSPKRITISYTQVLKADDGLVGYVYPLNTEKFSSKPIQDVSIKIELESDRPLKSIYSPSHDVEIRRHGPRRATAGFEAVHVKPDIDFGLYFAQEKDELGINLIAHKISGEDGYFLLLASPGTDADDRKIVPKDVVFVLDTSGSMAGKKLDQAKKALHYCVENLNEGDRFEILRFSTETEPLFDRFVDTSKPNRNKAAAFIEGLKPTGGTAINDALLKALALASPDASDPQRVRVVIFLTDGKPTIGVTEETRIVDNVKQANPGRTRVFCFGIGLDVNAHLLDKITEETRAVSQYVLPEEDIEVKVSNFFAKIKEPVLANPALQFTGDVRVRQMYPSPLPDLFRGDQLVLVGRYQGQGDSVVLLEGMVNGARRKFSYEVSFPRDAADHEFIPRLWATRRVGYLLDEIRLHGENSELKDEVTELARKYGIVTPYTAYLIVEDEDRRQVPLASQSLPRLYSDRAVRREAAENWRSFNTMKDGQSAVAGARYGQALKMANAPAPASASGAIEANRALGLNGTVVTSAAPAPDSRARLVQFAQQGQFVAGRNFFQNDQQWIDASVQKFQNAKRQRIQFNSPEYFAFAAKNPKALPFLSLGQNVQFVLNDTLYEIHE
ncbi:MAG TPA: VIT domain-containing protein [Candidatus Paceibacterota bacterium]|nr:VIT domain-containing protein [Verrucomicrobiota bacterium]HRY50383.1 VIT domain-containing protein [Candidatus Paceibacterota bacterium]